MYARRLPIQSFTATTAFVGSSAGGVAIVATDLTRANLKLQPLTDALRLSPIGSLTGSSMLVASQQIFEAPDRFTGPLFIAPNAGATAPSRSGRARSDERLQGDEFLSIGLADGERRPINTRDVLPQEWIDQNAHQIRQLVEVSGVSGAANARARDGQA